MISVVSSRGQLVIPSIFRKKYGIKPHAKVEWIDTEKGIVLFPIPDDLVILSRGMLKKTSTKDLLKYRKEDRKINGRNK